MFVCPVCLIVNGSMCADGRYRVVLTVGVITHQSYFDFIRATVTQTEPLCYAGTVCSFSPENIQGLFTDSSNTTVVDLWAFFPPSEKK